MKAFVQDRYGSAEVLLRKRPCCPSSQIHKEGT